MKFILTFLFCLLSLTSNSQNWVSEAEVNLGELIELYPFKDKLFVGGDFTIIDTKPASGIAYWDKVKWKSFIIDGLPYISIRSFSTYNGQLFGYGSKSPLPGEIVKYNEFENSWEPIPNSEISWNGGYGVIHHAIEFKNELYIAGIFDFIGEKPFRNIAKWNGLEWLQVLDTSGHEIQVQDITALEIFNENLILSGTIIFDYTEIYKGIVEWNGESLSKKNKGSINNEIIFSPLSLSKVHDFEVYKEELYAGVTFVSLIDDEDSNNYSIIKWNGSDWIGVQGFEFESNNNAITALKSIGNYLVIGGFNPTNSKGVTFLFNGTSVNKIEQDFNFAITSIQEFDKQIYAVGGVGQDTFSNGIARLGNIAINEETASSCNFFPNPTSGEFLISYEISENSKTIISFFNPLGELVKQEIFNDLKGSYLRKLDLLDFPTGTYVIKIQSKGIEESKLIIKD